MIDQKLIDILESKLAEEDGAPAESSLDYDAPLELDVTFRILNGDAVKCAPKVVVYLSEVARVEGFAQRAKLLEKRQVEIPVH